MNTYWTWIFWINTFCKTNLKFYPFKAEVILMRKLAADIFNTHFLYFCLWYISKILLPQKECLTFSYVFSFLTSETIKWPENKVVPMKCRTEEQQLWTCTGERNNFLHSNKSSTTSTRAPSFFSSILVCPVIYDVADTWIKVL